MACLGTISVEERTISTVVSDALGAPATLVGIAGEGVTDSTVRGFYDWAGSLFQQVNLVTGEILAQVGGKDCCIFFTSQAIATVADTRDYCECNGLCF